MEETNTTVKRDVSTPPLARGGVATPIPGSGQRAPGIPLRPSDSVGQGEDVVSALPAKATPIEAAEASETMAPVKSVQSSTAPSPAKPASPPSPKPSGAPTQKISKPPAARPQQASPPSPPPAAEAEEGGEGAPNIELPDLTETQISFLSSKRYLESGEELKRDFALTDEDLSFLNEMDRAVLGGLIDLKQYVTALRGEFPLLNDEEKGRLIAHCLADRFVPFGTEVRPSAEEAAKEANLALPKTPYYRIYSKPLTFLGAAHEVARTAGISLMGQTQERLRDIIRSRIKGVRMDAQVEDQLKRTTELGGLGLKSEHAKIATEAISDIIGRAKIVTEEEYSALLSKEIHGEPKKPPPKPLVTTPEQKEEEKEIAEIIGKMPKAEQDNATVLAESIRTVLNRLTWRPESSYLQRRLTNMISTRLRDVRSRNEFFMKLMRDVKVGGLGLDRKQAEKVTREVEEGYNEFRGNVLKEEKERLARQLEEQERKIEERKQKESVEHARWFEEKIKSKQEAEAEHRRAFERLKVIAQGKTTPIKHPVEAKGEAKERAEFGELVSVRPPVKRGKEPKEVILPRRELRKPEAPPRKAPAKPVVKVSTVTARMQEAAKRARPKIEDVRTAAGPRLTGPIQEIGSVTLEQFRRIGNTPEEAAKRLEEKVDLLAQESFEKRIAGIQAWQRSPLQKKYLSLLADAFRAGKQVRAFVEEKRAAGEEVPSIEELDAIMALNNKLRL